jgi:transcriptional regulator with XRE-family HTH domain
MTARRRSFVRLVEHLQQELLSAYEEERTRHRLTRHKMAELLNSDKASLAQQLNVTANMTLETLADLAYALNRPVRISLPSRDAMLRPGDNRSAPPPPHLSLSAGTAPVTTPSYAVPAPSPTEAEAQPQAQPQIVIVMRSL